jgi:hypothetical protein
MDPILSALCSLSTMHMHSASHNFDTSTLSKSPQPKYNRFLIMSRHFFYSAHYWFLGQPQYSDLYGVLKSRHYPTFLNCEQF